MMALASHTLEIPDVSMEVIETRWVIIPGLNMNVDDGRLAGVVGPSGLFQRWFRFLVQVRLDGIRFGHGPENWSREESLS